MAEATPNLDPNLFEKNLTALRGKDPALAEQVAAGRSRTGEILPAATRDGRVNFRMHQADGSEPWFGRTSIPLVRAGALVDRFQAGNANVLLPGIGEGTEVELLLQRLPPHRAVFVWETDAVNLALAMSLHDWAREIEHERLILVLADPDHLTDSLLRTLEQMPGHLCPDRLLLWPWQTLAGIVSCRTAVEAAFHHIEARRRVQLAQLQSRLASLPAASAKDSSRTAALFSIHTTDETRAWGKALESAARDAGFRVIPIVVNHPADVHPLARASRLSAALDRAPDLAVLLDVCRQEVCDVLPPSIPAVIWLSQSTTVTGDMPGRLGDSDRILAGNSGLLDRLVEAGIDRGRILVRPRPALLTCPEPLDWADRSIDLALVASLASTDGPSYGFDLPTHLGIWRVALQLLQQELDGVTDADIQSILLRAESAAGRRIDDSAVRRRLAEVLGGPVAETMIWRDLVQVSATSGLKIECWGSGWVDGAGVSARGAIPGLPGRLEIYRQAKCVVFANPLGVVSPDVLVAAGAGAAVLWRGHPRDSTVGGFAGLLEPDSEAMVFRRNQNLSRAARQVLEHPERWRNLVSRARARCRFDHSPAAAWAAVQADATSFFGRPDRLR